MFEALKESNKELKWRKCHQLPCKMWGASAAVLGNTIYVSGGNSSNDLVGNYVYAYHLLKNSWETLPGPSHRYGIPVVAANQLYIIGGKSNKKGQKYTSQVSRYENNEWKACCNMKKERYAPLAVTYKDHIIVAGGKDKSLLFGLLHDIEVLNVNDVDNKMKWRTVPTKLPMGMWAPSATILNDELWIAGFNNNSDLAIRRDQRSDEVCWIRLTEGILKGAEDKTKDWVHLPQLVPYYCAAVVPNTSPLIPVGDDTPDAKTVTSTIIQYDHWNNIASLDGPS